MGFCFQILQFIINHKYMYHHPLPFVNLTTSSVISNCKLPLLQDYILFSNHFRHLVLLEWKRNFKSFDARDCGYITRRGFTETSNHLPCQHYESVYPTINGDLLPLRKSWSFMMNCICWRQQPTVKLLFSEQSDFTMFTSIWHIFSDHTSDHFCRSRDFTLIQKCKLAMLLCVLIVDNCWSSSQHRK